MSKTGLRLRLLGLWACCQARRASASRAFWLGGWFAATASPQWSREGPPSDGRQVRRRRKQFGRRGAR